MINLRQKLFEGGNVFKNDAGQITTARVEKKYIKPTVAPLEEVVGFTLDQWLGSTGVEPTSGDIDIAVDAETHDKQSVANQIKDWMLTAGLRPSEWVRLSGNNVHVKLPIRNNRREVMYHNGNPIFAQVDLVFGDTELLVWSMRGEPKPFKGVHRQIVMSSIAKAKGLKWSYSNGLVNRQTDEVITTDPSEIVNMLLPGYSSDPYKLNINSILQYIYARYKNEPAAVEKLLGDAVGVLAEQFGVRLPTPADVAVHESNDPDEYFLAKLRDKIVATESDVIMEGKLRDMNHIEDLILEEGPAGLQRAVDILRALVNGTASSVTTVKWDGCISGDSILVTPGGDRTIADVVDSWRDEHIRVLAHDFDTGDDVFVSVDMANKQHGSKEWVKVVLSNGEIIKMTEDHQVFTTNRGWVSAGELTAGDDIKESSIK